MVLISPATSTQAYFDLGPCGLESSSLSASPASVSSSPPHGTRLYLPTTLPEFDYEPQFPILLLDDIRNRAHMLSNHHLLKGGANESPFVRSAFIEALDEEGVFTEIMTWLDELGL
jgi:hypothetical protein